MGICRVCKAACRLYCVTHGEQSCVACAMDRHATCSVVLYRDFLWDADISPIGTCALCSEALAGDCVRLPCGTHAFHLACLAAHGAALPATTAPAGYACPACDKPMLPLDAEPGVREKMLQFLAGQPWGNRADPQRLSAGLATPPLATPPPPARRERLSLHTPDVVSSGPVLPPLLSPDEPLSITASMDDVSVMHAAVGGDSGLTVGSATARVLKLDEEQGGGRVDEEAAMHSSPVEVIMPEKRKWRLSPKRDRRAPTFSGAGSDEEADGSSSPVAMRRRRQARKPTSSSSSFSRLSPAMKLVLALMLAFALFIVIAMVNVGGKRRGAVVPSPAATSASAAQQQQM
eukprot:PLAT5677.1.p1 GENE.PLAT5677.1~~PLAT5677.1.p1  ORF type:complete len:346 (-),score=79.16 PLAT5677.1:85-1122(-)